MKNTDELIENLDNNVANIEKPDKKKDRTTANVVFEFEKGKEITLSPKKQCKELKVENGKINKILKKILKHIKYLDKEILIFKKFNGKNKLIGLHFKTLIDNFQETLANLKRERDFLEQKHLDNKIFLDKLIDKIKNK